MKIFIFILCCLICLVFFVTIYLIKKKTDISTNKIYSITKIIFLTSQISALVWVFISYGIAIYSTIVLEKVYTMSELSEPAINIIIGVTALKVLENIFEHNNGGIFGTTHKEG